MKISSVRDSLSPSQILDDLEHGCSLKEYYVLNHTIPEQREKLHAALTETLKVWLNDIGIDVCVNGTISSID